MAEWFMALSWKGSEGNTSASSNLVSSSKVVCLVVGQLKLCRVSAHHLYIGESSNGRTTVSKTVYYGFESLLPCQS